MPLLSWRSRHRALVLLLFAATYCLGGVARAGEPETMRLWADGAPGAMFDEPGDQPTLTLYPAASESPTPAVVILPGGGYGHLAIDHEGHQIAAWLHSLNITAGICEYRHRGRGNNGKGYGHPAPMQDAQRAIRLMRANAEAWNIAVDQIGVIGFSAGGHLASTVSTHFDAGNADNDDPVQRVSSRPDFAILCYPVIGFDKPYTHRGSQRNLLGESADPLLVQMLSNETQVTEQTPPTFLWATTEDTVVPPENSVQYYLSLIRRQVPSEMHLFERGRHGLGLGVGTPDVSLWPQLCENWLRVRGILPPRDDLP
jgi:acetyl esterase/lipase